MNLIQKISAIAGAVFFSFWLFAAYDAGFELFDPDVWGDGFDKGHLQVSFALFVGSVVSYFVFKDDSPTITKKRYVDHLSKSKSLGVYSINDSQMNGDNQTQLHSLLDELIPRHDLVIVSDYGHGFLSRETAKKISKLSIFISLNAQVNAANIGYHTMNNYHDIDCTIINETELRHELRDRESSVDELMKQLSKSLNFKKLVVTQGDSGATFFDSE